MEGGLVGLSVVYSTVLHGEPQSWFVSCGGCWVSADTGLSGVGAWICEWSEGWGCVQEQNPPLAWFRARAAAVGVSRNKLGLAGERSDAHV